MTTDPLTMQVIIQDGYGSAGRTCSGSIGPHDPRPAPTTSSSGSGPRASTPRTGPPWRGCPTPSASAVRTAAAFGTPIRGTDVAGVVEAVGPRVTDLQPGDEVLGSLWGSTVGSRAGAFAHYAVATADPNSCANPPD